MKLELSLLILFTTLNRLTESDLINTFSKERGKIQRDTIYYLSNNKNSCDLFMFSIS